MTATLEYYSKRTKECKVTLEGKTYDALEIETRFIFEGHTIIDGKKTEFHTDYKQVFVYGYRCGSIHYFDYPFVFDFGHGQIPGGREEWLTKKVHISETK